MMFNNDLELLAKELILEFNRLVTTEQERNTQEYVQLSVDLVVEELDELDDANLAGNKKEILKELCDLFVVKVQLKDCLSNLTASIDNDLLFVTDHVSSMAEMDFATTFKLFNPKNVYGAILAVCYSNMTKVPLLSDVKNVYGDNWEESACDWIETNSKGRYKDIKAHITSDSSGKDRVVFRADGGEGKVVKWVGYRDPSLSPFVSVDYAGR